MTAEEKAIFILERMNNGKLTKSLWGNCSEYARHELKRKVLICISEIEIALTDYGNESLELQNMDAEFRYWESVREAVNSFSIKQ